MMNRYVAFAKILDNLEHVSDAQIQSLLDLFELELFERSQRKQVH